jgi:hypothetical protein
MSKYTKTIKWNSAEIEVNFDFEAGDPGVWTYSNGDPGYPPTDDEFIINSVFYKNIEVTDLFDDVDLIRMEEIIESSRYEYDE